MKLFKFLVGTFVELVLTLIVAVITLLVERKLASTGPDLWLALFVGPIIEEVFVSSSKSAGGTNSLLQENKKTLNKNKTTTARITLNI